MRKFTAVVDTNVLVSSLWGGAPGKVIKKWDEGVFLSAVSPEILEEYISVISRFDINREELDDFVMLFLNPAKCIFAAPRKKINLITKDPADNKFLECALAAKADYIVSDDRHLLEIKQFMKTKIIPPAEFLKKL
ncbi:MAG TPA: putative toxin-antitoxin system toxin component, PIN family [Firmicutes bacterium]|nr:putative toxin-antitoxin system toxin component, PIN family [Bacillota bacterium]